MKIIDKIREGIKKFIDWVFSLDFVLFVAKLGFAILFSIAIILFQIKCFLWSYICLVAWFFSGVVYHFLEKNKEKEFNSIKKQNEELQIENLKCNERYNLLLPLMDTAFDSQMTSLHNEIRPYVTNHIRTSVYMYDPSKDNFRCFARHSSNGTFCKKNKKDQYPNKGWLQSTWNNQEYKFICDYSDIDIWIKKCKEECRNNCYNPNCHNKSCISVSKERLQKINCSMLSKDELKAKTMKAKSVFGYVLKQDTRSLGIILVEGMDIWGDNSFNKIRERVIKYSNASIEILSLHGQQLLELFNTADNQDDMADAFMIGGRKYAK